METGTMIVFLFLCINLCIAEPFDWQADNEINTGGLSRASFPKGFVFGTATSAYQVEGAAKTEGRGPSIWDTFIRKPGIIANNATADVSVDEYHRYKADVELMVKMNMDAYRFSISWSRIFPSKADTWVLIALQIEYVQCPSSDKLVRLKTNRTPYEEVDIEVDEWSPVIWNTRPKGSQFYCTFDLYYNLKILMGKVLTEHVHPQQDIITTIEELQQQNQVIDEKLDLLAEVHNLNF